MSVQHPLLLDGMRRVLQQRVRSGGSAPEEGVAEGVCCTRKPSV